MDPRQWVRVQKRPSTETEEGNPAGSDPVIVVNAE
jgi:hypothetical protein